MSKVVLRQGAPVQSFGALLSSVPAELERTRRVQHLSRTELGLRQLTEEARKEGFDAGYEEGLKAGAAEGRTQFEEAHQAMLFAFAESLDSLLGDFAASTTSWYASAEPKLAELGVLIATRILGDELKLEPKRIADIAAEAVAEITHATKAKVRANVADYPHLQGRESALIAAAPSVENLEVVADASVPNGVLVETEGGLVDGTIDTQILSALSAIRGEQ